MTLLLVGDIGGTKTLLRLVETTTDRPPKTWKPDKLYEALYSSADFPDLVPMVRQFLDGARTELGRKLEPKKACFAIAGPVIGTESKLTNLGWTLSVERLEADLGIPSITLINDFAAVGYGILGLSEDDLHTLQVGEPLEDAPIATIGAGTGLGEGFLIRHHEGDRVYASEGGHADFSPRSPVEFELQQYLRDRHQLPRVSVERVVSGQGIVSIYQFLYDRAVSATGTAIGDRDLPAAEISKAALDGSHPLCQQTLQIFVDAYGAEAGNLALKLLPYGGLYLAGGIAAKILPLIEKGDRFLNAFHDKGRMSPLLQKVPIHIVLNPQVGLVGAAICAAQLD